LTSRGSQVRSLSRPPSYETSAFQAKSKGAALAGISTGEIDDKTVLDAAVVSHPQAVKHDEISRHANTKPSTIALHKGVNKKASAA
jgi:hypothetical protein